MAKARKVTRKTSKADLRSSTSSLLGRPKGVDSLIQSKKEITSNIGTIPVDKIEKNLEQPRKDFYSDAAKEALTELAESIKVHGIIQPITVRKMGDKYQIISGERRWRASQLAGLTEVPAYILEIADSGKVLEMAIVENVQRENLSAYEFIDSLKVLKDTYELTDDEIADKIGKARPTVSNYMRILDLGGDMLNALNDGDLSLGHARALVGLDDPVLRRDMYDAVIDNDLSVRALERRIKEAREAQNSPAEAAAPAPSKKKDELPTEYQDVEKTLKAFFGVGSAKIKLKDEAKGKGQILIPFDSVRELNRILDLLED